MVKEDFVKMLAEEEKVPVTTARPWVDAVFRNLRKAILENDKMLVDNIGVFEHKVHKGHGAYNFYTQEHYNLPDRLALSFRFSAKLKQDAQKAFTEEKG